MADLREMVVDYLEHGMVMHLATVQDNRPWVCTVNYLFDKDLTLYWLSLRTRRHSLEVAQNSAVAAAILLDPKVKRCLHIEGEADEVPGDELEQVNDLFTAKMGKVPRFWPEIKENRPDGRTYYRFKPSAYVLWDEVNFPDDPRQVLKLG
jgi:uncharacterized protein